jgi:putative glycerol-1-phosphate prenyltransferase
LISGRNAEYLIGQHVVAAPFLKQSGLEILPTGYMLVNCGNQTTVSYISNTTPIPYDKPEIAATTALAGSLLGLKVMYLDGGSGAQKPVSPAMLRYVKKATDAPLILGGGIRNAEQAEACWNAGADLIVVGTALEENPELMRDIHQTKHNLEQVPT